MSGNSYDASCPNCDGNMSCYSDHKPFDTSSGNCISCGFYYMTKASQDSLADLNAAREERNDEMEFEDEDRLEPLTELPEIKDWLKGYMTELL